MAANGESLDARIKRCVREELNATTRAPNQVQSLVARTRDLIRSSASSASRQLEAVLPNTTVSLHHQTPRASHSSHPLRFKKKATAFTTKAKKPKQIFPKSVYLLDSVCNEEEIEQDVDFVLKDDMILLKGEFDLESESSEQDIRCELKKVFSRKFPLITENNFDFVKRDRNTISMPVVKDGHTWDYAHVKHLCGTGRLYVRLNVPEECITRDTDSDRDEELEVSVFDRPSDDVSGPLLSTAGPSSCSTPSGSPSADAKVLTLSSLFPNAKKSDIHFAVVAFDDLDESANFLSEKYSIQQPQLNNAGHLEIDLTDDCSTSHLSTSTQNIQCTSTAKNDKNWSSAQILEKLRSKMKPYNTAEKIKVDRGDLVMDVFQYYKDPCFEPAYQVKFQVRGEPAVDTGGVRRQIYEEVFLSLVKGEKGFELFHGPPERVIPVYKSSNILTGMFEMLGKMVAHSLVQGCPGFPYLSPSIYWYLATGDLQQALAHISCIDVMGTPLEHYILKVRDATPVELAMLRSDEQFIEILQNCGETRLLSENNKLEIVQALVMHEVLIKHQTSLDQMRKGLSTLGLLDEIEKSPEKFESRFVHKDYEITNAFVKELLSLPDDEDTSTKKVLEMLLSFLDKADQEVLANFLGFVTGCRSHSAALKPGCIKVSVEDTSSIYASTCILQLKLPSHFTSVGQFRDSLCAVIDSTSFSTV